MLFIVLSSVLSLATFAWVLRPLWREKRAAASAVVLLLCVTVAAIYRLIGTPAALDITNVRAPQTLQEAITVLETKMRVQPERDGLLLLADAYTKAGEPTKARDTLERVIVMATPDAPADPNDLAAAAEARMRAHPSRRFDAKAVDFLERALQANPQHQRARFFLGIALRQQNKPAEAAQTWEPLLAQIASADSATLREEIDAARKEAGLQPLPPPHTSVQHASAKTDAVKPGTHALTVTVSLDPAFAARVRLRGDASVFVIARAPDGPPMPIAVQKHALSELPLKITLDDGDGPMPTRKLSAVQDIEVLARLSESGIANRQEGDIESKSVRVSLPAKQAVTLVIGAE